MGCGCSPAECWGEYLELMKEVFYNIVSSPNSLSLKEKRRRRSMWDDARIGEMINVILKGRKRLED